MATPTAEGSDDTAPANTCAQGILSLSPELIVEIASHIVPWTELRSLRRDLWAGCVPWTHNCSLTAGHEDLENLRLACRYLSQALQREVFKSLTINFHRDRYIQDPEDVEYRLTEITKKNSLASKHTTFLLIKCLTPMEGGAVMPGAPYVYPEDGGILDANELITRTLEFMSTHLEPAILSFQNLRCVAWNIGAVNEQSIGVVRALSSLPFLEDVTLSFELRCTKLSTLFINRFHDLRSLSVSFSKYSINDAPPGSVNPITDHIADIIVQSPRLRHLSVLKEGDQTYDISLPNLIKRVAPHRIANFESLRFALPGLVFNAEMALRFKALKSLRIEDYITTVDTGDDLWKHLADAQVHLQDITVSQLSEPLMKYLASYSGLERLHVLLTTYRHRSNDNYDTQVFFKEILLRHSLSARTTFARPDDGLTSENGVVFHVNKAASSSSVRSWSVIICVDSVPQALSFILDSVNQSKECLVQRLCIFYSSSLWPIFGRGLERHQHIQFGAGQQWVLGVKIPNQDVERYPGMIILQSEEYVLKSMSNQPDLYAYSLVEI